VSDDAMKATVQAAYRRLAKTVLASIGASDNSQQLREVVRKTLTDLGEQIDANPTWLDEVIREVTGGPSDPEAN
jgi:hypothetical protein